MEQKLFKTILIVTVSFSVIALSVIAYLIYMSQNSGLPSLNSVYPTINMTSPSTVTDSNVNPSVEVDQTKEIKSEYSYEYFTGEVFNIELKSSISTPSEILTNVENGYFTLISEETNMTLTTIMPDSATIYSETVPELN